MPRAKAQQDAVLKRRELVAALMGKGFTVRQIADGLAKVGMINPDTGEAYTHVTVQHDITALRRQMMARTNKQLDAYRADHLIKTQQLYADALKAGNFGAALGALKRQAELLGLDAPQRVEIDVRVMDTLRKIEALGVNPSDAVNAMYEQMAAMKQDAG